MLSQGSSRRDRIGQGLEAARGVDRVADGGEAGGGVETHLAHDRRAGMNADAKTRPGAAGCFRGYLTTIVPAMYR
jgi:hypothetical protein